MKPATSVITGAGLDYPPRKGGQFDSITEELTVPSDQSSPNRSRSPSPTELNVLITGTEGEPQPLVYTSITSSLGMGASGGPQKSLPPAFKVPQMPPRGAFRRMMSRGYARQTSLDVYSRRVFETDRMYYRRLSVDPMGLTGDNLSHVTMILHKMAQAIQRDIEDDVSV